MLPEDVSLSLFFAILYLFTVLFALLPYIRDHPEDVSDEACMLQMNARKFIGGSDTETDAAPVMMQA